VRGPARVLGRHRVIVVGLLDRGPATVWVSVLVVLGVVVLHRLPPSGHLAEPVAARQ
jgi:hypothetical protein